MCNSACPRYESRLDSLVNQCQSEAASVLRTNEFWNWQERLEAAPLAFQPDIAALSSDPSNLAHDGPLLFGHGLQPDAATTRPLTAERLAPSPNQLHTPVRGL